MIDQATLPFINTRNDAGFHFLGLPTVMRSTGEQTNGAFGLVEHTTMPPGFSTPYHTHHREDEAFYILTGEVAFVVDGQWIVAGPGDFAYGPRNIPHGFKVVGDQPASMLILAAPAGFEKFLVELGTDPALPPSPPDMQRLMQVAAEFQIDIHGPLPDGPDYIPSGATDSKAIDAVRQAHVECLNIGDSAAMAALFAEDAVQMPPNAAANAGREAIAAWFQGLFNMMSVKFSLSPTEVQLTGDVAIETGSYELSGAIHGTPVTIHDSGKYITVYHRSPLGKWEISKDIWNSNQPAPNPS